MFQLWVSFTNWSVDITLIKTDFGLKTRNCLFFINEWILSFINLSYQNNTSTIASSGCIKTCSQQFSFFFWVYNYCKFLTAKSKKTIFSGAKSMKNKIDIINK